MEYQEFIESITRDKTGKFTIYTRYSRKGIEQVAEAVVDDASSAHRRLLEFRAAFKTKLVEAGLARRKDRNVPDNS